MKKQWRIGTRGSPLALIQAEMVRDALQKFLDPNETSVEIVSIRTTGDWKPEHKEQTFLQMGATKGLFTKEIEEALLTDHIDIAVHSMKDVAVAPPENLFLAAYMERADPHDAFISTIAPRLEDLPQGARVGTASLRRTAQIKAVRPDLLVSPLRGNVDTRLGKLMNGEADATILAVAGLTRLGRMDRVSSVLPFETMLPAVAQGVLGVQIRRDDEEAYRLVSLLNHEATASCVVAERALLAVLDGSCRTPIAALAHLNDEGRIEMEALLARPDGSEVIRRKNTSLVQDAEHMATDLGRTLRALAPSDFYSS